MDLEVYISALITNSYLGESIGEIIIATPLKDPVEDNSKHVFGKQKNSMNFYN